MANVPISAFTVPANTVGIGATGYSLTGSASASFMDLAGTWNTSGTPTAIRLNITDTASNAASLLMDLGTGGGSFVSRFKVQKNGDTTFNLTGGSISINNANGIDVGTFNLTRVNGVQFGAGNDLILGRRTAANLRLGAADAAAPVAQTLSVQGVVAGTTNTAGTNLTITGSQGTGTGAGGSIVFQVAPAGSSGSAQNALATALTIASNRETTFASNVLSGGYVQSTSYLQSLSNGNILFGGSAGDISINRDAADTLALRRGTAAQTFNVYNTFTDASNYERGALAWVSNVLTISAENAGTGSNRGVAVIGKANATLESTLASVFLRTSSANRWSVDPSGHFLAAVDNTLDIGASGANRPRSIYVAGAVVSSIVRVQNINNLNNTHTLLTLTDGSDNLLFATGGTSPRVNFCGTTSSFPALKRSTTFLQARLADDSAFAGFASANMQAATAYTVATLPTPATGMIARVTDATAPTIGTTVVGGGAAYALVNYNGANWTVIGV